MISEVKSYFCLIIIIIVVSIGRAETMLTKVNGELQPKNI